MLIKHTTQKRTSYDLKRVACRGIYTIKRTEILYLDIELIINYKYAVKSDTRNTIEAETSMRD